jgi:hypothetical protein
MDVEIAVPIENARVQYFVFGLLPGPLAVFLPELFVREGLLRVLVQVFHVEMGGHIVEVVIEFLDILPVVALIIAQPKESFLEDMVLTVPEGDAETEVLVEIRDAGDAIFTPAVGPAMGVFKREITPCIAMFAIVFPHGTPLSFTQVRAPGFQGNVLFFVYMKSLFFRIHAVKLSFP